MQEIDNHRTFNYFLSVVPELSHHEQELSETRDLRTLLSGRMTESIIRRDLFNNLLNKHTWNDKSSRKNRFVKKRMTLSNMTFIGSFSDILSQNGLKYKDNL